MTSPLHPSARRRLARPLGLVVVGGLAAGAGFATVSGIAGAATPAVAVTPAAATPTTPPGSTERLGMHQRHHRGVGGTVTAIHGTTLTLRTEAGTETVTTSPTTNFTRARQAITLADVHVADIVHVAVVRGAAAAERPAAAGTVAARAVTVVEPTVTGRVQAVSGATLTVVGRDGVVETVTTNPATRYFRGRAAATAADVAVGERIVAEGSRTGVAALGAEVVTIRPLRPAPTAPPAPGA